MKIWEIHFILYIYILISAMYFSFLQRLVQCIEIHKYGNNVNEEKLKCL
jgi:hypothetical protein